MPIVAYFRINNLTAIERDVYDLLTEGKLVKQIANELGIGHRTVDTHIRNIKNKAEKEGLVFAKVLVAKQS